jgi:hypothetical protein
MEVPLKQERRGDEIAENIHPQIEEEEEKEEDRRRRVLFVGNVEITAKKNEIEGLFRGCGQVK